MQGFSYLSTANDLLEKLIHDLNLLKAEPGNAYLAFNMLVTAEHLPDWYYPGNEHKRDRKRLREENAILAICSHVANGAKHFRVEASHHQSVREVTRNGVYGEVFGHTFGQVFGGELVIDLKCDAEQAFGATMNAVELGERLVRFWSQVLSN
ncbi:MAG: hypothetical protein WBC44_00780 [Planctomycetaceae bacterium]